LVRRFFYNFRLRFDETYSQANKIKFYERCKQGNVNWKSGKRT
jgi:hypothetical protein